MGYPLELFVGAIDNGDLICSICHEVLQNPKFLQPCGHSFCNQCITEWSARSSTCPMDRQSIGGIRNLTKVCVELINGLEMWCPFKGIGCPTTVRLGDLLLHETGCDFNPQNRKECATGGCGAMLNKAEAQGHDCVAYLKEELKSKELELEKLKATNQELENLRNWPPFGDRELNSQRIIGLLDQVMGLDGAYPFVDPVDPDEYPDYAYEISYPVNLNGIKTKLQNLSYQSLDALKFDIRHIAVNAERFNRPMTEIVKLARIITDICLRICNRLDFTDVAGLFNRLYDHFEWEETADPSTP